MWNYDLLKILLEIDRRDKLDQGFISAAAVVGHIGYQFGTLFII